MANKDLRWLFVDGDYLIAYLYFRGPEVVQNFWLEIAGFVEKFGIGKVAIAWDDRKGKRRVLHPEYKKGRNNIGNWQAMKPEVKKEVIECAVNFPVVMGRMPDLEADDLIWIWTRNYDGVIISGDLDLWQCLRNGVDIWMPRKKQLAGIQDVGVEYGGDQVAMLMQRCLIGDRSDNIPGVDGIGERRARELWDKYGKHLVQVALEGAAAKEPDKWLNVVEQSREVLQRNWKLMKFEAMIEDSELVLGELQLDKEVKFDIESARRYCAWKGWHLIFQQWPRLVKVYERLNKN